MEKYTARRRLYLGNREYAERGEEVEISKSDATALLERGVIQKVEPPVKNKSDTKAAAKK